MMTNKNGLHSSLAIKFSVIEAFLKLASEGRLVNIKSLNKKKQVKRPQVINPGIHHKIHSRLGPISRSFLIDGDYPIRELWPLLPLSHSQVSTAQDDEYRYCFERAELTTVSNSDKMMNGWFNVFFCEKEVSSLPFLRRIGVVLPNDEGYPSADFLSKISTLVISGCEVFLQIPFNNKVEPELLFNIACSLGINLVIEPSTALLDHEVTDWDEKINAYMALMQQNPRFSGSIYPISCFITEMALKQIGYHSTKKDPISSYFYNNKQDQEAIIKTIRANIGESTDMDMILSESARELEGMLFSVKDDYLRMMADYLESTSDQNLPEVWREIFALLDITNKEFGYLFEDMVSDRRNSGESYLSSLSWWLSDEGFIDVPADLWEKHGLRYGSIRDDCLKVGKILSSLVMAEESTMEK